MSIQDVGVPVHSVHLAFPNLDLNHTSKVQITCPDLSPLQQDPETHWPRT